MTKAAMLLELISEQGYRIGIGASDKQGIPIALIKGSTVKDKIRVPNLKAARKQLDAWKKKFHITDADVHWPDRRYRY